MSADGVLIVGSANVDTFLRVATLPRPGETVIGADVVTAIGGKGANQAIAAARTGVPVQFVGAVGRDADGERMLTALAHAGVVIDGVDRVDAPTGRAMIIVDDAGENSIVVTPGANALVPAPTGLPSARALVVQGELRPATTIAAIEAGISAGMRVIVNLAPFVDLGGVERAGDPLVLNEIEAEQLLGIPIAGADSAGVARLREHARSAVVTLGADGALVIGPDGTTVVPTPRRAEVVDTTGAGDAFVGVLAAALASGSDLVAATRLAVNAATASVEVLGAGENYPAFTLEV